MARNRRESCDSISLLVIDGPYHAMNGIFRHLSHDLAGHLVARPVTDQSHFLVIKGRAEAVTQFLVASGSTPDANILYRALKDEGSLGLAEGDWGIDLWNTQLVDRQSVGDAV